MEALGQEQPAQRRRDIEYGKERTSREAERKQREKQQNLRENKRRT